MRTGVFDALLRLFYRAQATLTMIPMFGMVLADRDAAGATLMAALATDFARWLLRGRRWLPAVLGSALVLGGIALATAAVAGGGAGAAVLPVPVPDYPGAPLLNPRSVFLVAIERAGGAGLVFALAVAMGLAQAGVFLLFAGERSAYVRRAQLVERPDRLGLTTVAAPFALQVFFVLITVGSLHAGVINQRPPVQPRRWVIERTFSWTGRCRRLARDHEATPSSAIAFFVLAAATVLLRRLAKPL